ncbi:MAG: cell division protein ZapB [Spirochaetaceae bacterium]|jgi:FtsZ-binding cell division protein ZapB|nr:cell division protein ZapB [Spirochaetaceae bacterium]
MVTIEQVELLESKVSKAIDYVKRLTADNEQLRETSAQLVSENDMLCGKLDGYQKRITELEAVLQGFKKDQERIEQGIISSLERLNRFEDAVGNMVPAGDPVPLDETSGGTTADVEVPSASSVSASASAVPPSATPASTGIPAAPVFPEPVPSEPFGEEEEEFADEPEADDDASGQETPDSGVETPAETFGETADGMEIDIDENDDFSVDGEDEFLDALKSDRPSGLGQIAAAFHDNARPPSESTLEKPLNGLELDIF